MAPTYEGVETKVPSEPSHDRAADRALASEEPGGSDS